MDDSSNFNWTVIARSTALRIDQNHYGRRGDRGCKISERHWYSTGNPSSRSSYAFRKILQSQRHPSHGSVSKDNGFIIRLVLPPYLR